TLYAPVGSHSGTTAVAVLAWVTAWCVLHGRWQAAQVDFRPVFLGALALIALGCLGTFPPLYQALGALLTAPPGGQPPQSEAMRSTLPSRSISSRSTWSVGYSSRMSARRRVRCSVWARVSVSRSRATSGPSTSL